MTSLYEKYFGKAPPFSESKFEKEQNTESPVSIMDKHPEYRSLLQSKNFTPESITDIERYLDIFSRDPTPVLKYIEEMATEGRSDIKNFIKFMHPEDKMKWGDYNYLGKKPYDMMYRKETKQAKAATNQMLTSGWMQPAIGVSSGAYNTVAGIAELGAALSDLTLDTDTLSIVELLLPPLEYKLTLLRF